MPGLRVLYPGFGAEYEILSEASEYDSLTKY
jgi:hypothetical protein